MTTTSSPASAVEEHDGRLLSDRLDRSFVLSAAKGYLLGLLVFGAFVYFTITSLGDQPPGVGIAIAAAVAFWVGLLAGVVLIGIWTHKNEHELFGRDDD